MLTKILIAALVLFLGWKVLFGRKGHRMAKAIDKAANLFIVAIAVYLLLQAAVTYL